MRKPGEPFKPYTAGLIKERAEGYPAPEPEEVKPAPPASFHFCPICGASWKLHGAGCPDLPDPARIRAELRRLDLMDVSLTLHCAALFMMAPPAQE